MSSVLASLVVTALFLAVAAVEGRRVGRTGKPYGFVWTTIHIVLFALVVSGVIASIYKLQALSSGGRYVQIALYIAMLTLLINLAIGARMILIKNRSGTLIAIHSASTVVMAISILASILFATAAIYP